MSGSVHRNVATVVKSSKEDYVKWKEGREEMEIEERRVDPRIIAHKERREELANKLYEKKEKF